LTSNKYTCSNAAHLSLADDVGLALLCGELVGLLELLFVLVDLGLQLLELLRKVLLERDRLQLLLVNLYSATVVP
jgi:hypothetical protein